MRDTPSPPPKQRRVTPVRLSCRVASRLTDRVMRDAPRATTFFDEEGGGTDTGSMICYARPEPPLLDSDGEDEPDDPHEAYEQSDLYGEFIVPYDEYDKKSARLWYSVAHVGLKGFEVADVQSRIEFAEDTKGTLERELHDAPDDEQTKAALQSIEEALAHYNGTATDDPVEVVEDPMLEKANIPFMHIDDFTPEMRRPAELINLYNRKVHMNGQWVQYAATLLLPSSLPRDACNRDASVAKIMAALCGMSEEDVVECLKKKRGANAALGRKKAANDRCMANVRDRQQQRYSTT